MDNGNPAPSKAALLADLRSVHAEADTLVRDLDADQLARPATIGEWSVQDVFAHLAGYEGLFVEATEAHLRGEPPSLERMRPPMSIDERNAGDVEQRRSQPARAVVDESGRVLARLIELTEGLPESFLIEPQTFEGVPEPVLIWAQLQHVVRHRRAHLAPVRAWLASHPS